MASSFADRTRQKEDLKGKFIKESAKGQSQHDQNCGIGRKEHAHRDIKARTSAYVTRNDCVAQ